MLLLRPRHGVIEPAPVRPESYFSAAELDRARDFRRPSCCSSGARSPSSSRSSSWSCAGRRGPDRPPRAAVPRRGGGRAAALSPGARSPLPLDAILRQRAVDVGLVTQSWGGWTATCQELRDRRGPRSRRGALLDPPDQRVSRQLVAAGDRARSWRSPRSSRTRARWSSIPCSTASRAPAGQTRQDVLDLARRAAFEVGQVYEVDASRRTTAANAYVTGLGSTKRVVLYDNLVQHFTRDETRLVVAHELGHVHYRRRAREACSGSRWSPRSRCSPSARLSEPARRRRGRARAAARCRPRGARRSPSWRRGDGIDLQPLSRRVEARADTFSLRDDRRGGAVHLVRAADRLRNVGDPDPPGWVTRLLGTHPPTIERIGAGGGLRARRALGASAAFGGSSSGWPNSGRFLIPSRVRHLE